MSLHTEILNDNDNADDDGADLYPDELRTARDAAGTFDGSGRYWPYLIKED